LGVWKFVKRSLAGRLSSLPLVSALDFFSSFSILDSWFFSGFSGISFSSTHSHTPSTSTALEGLEDGGSNQPTSPVTTALVPYYLLYNTHDTTRHLFPT